MFLLTSLSSRKGPIDIPLSLKLELLCVPESQPKLCLDLFFIACIDDDFI